MQKKNIRHWVYSSLLMLIAASLAIVSGTVYSQGLVTGKPGMNRYTDKEPGETQPLERAYEIAPPAVPHSVAGMEITRTANDCMDCHMDGDELDAGHIATKIPESHLVNEFTGEKAEQGVVGIRYNCLQCHVPQADAPDFFSQQ